MSSSKQTQKLKPADSSKAEPTQTLSLRAGVDMAERIKAVAIASRRKPAAVLAICVEDYLPQLEKALGIKPGEKPVRKTKI